jgi:hypothetical protein
MLRRTIRRHWPAASSATVHKVAVAILVLGASGWVHDADAALCDGSHPILQVLNVPITPVTGSVTARLFWKYDGPSDCKDVYNVRGGIIGQPEQQFEGAHNVSCPSQSAPSCTANVTVQKDKPYRFIVQACNKRLFQSSECSQWSNPQFFLPFGPDTCKDGFVWREAIANDRVCVPPATRSAVAFDNSQAAARRSPNGGPIGPDTCRQGFVWREVIPTDHVCVTLQTRQQARDDNGNAAARKARS